MKMNVAICLVTSPTFCRRICHSSRLLLQIKGLNLAHSWTSQRFIPAPHLLSISDHSVPYRKEETGPCSASVLHFLLNFYFSCLWLNIFDCT